MPKYSRQEDDREYRVVYPTAKINPELTTFTAQAQVVNYPENAVLEVVKSDGSSHLHYNSPVVSSFYSADENVVRIGAEIPINRLWLRRADGIGICYKVPVDLPVVDGCREVFIPEGTDNIELFLDPYAAKAYTLERI